MSERAREVGVVGLLPSVYPYSGQPFPVHPRVSGGGRTGTLTQDFLPSRRTGTRRVLSRRRVVGVRRYYPTLRN